jgi:hypothetical protein
MACTSPRAVEVDANGGLVDGGSGDEGSVESGFTKEGAADGPCSPDATCSLRVSGVARLLELSGTVASPGGSLAVKELDAFVSFQAFVKHDYDDRQGSLGCFADHYQATAQPAPVDVDAGWLRISGFTEGPLLSGAQAAQPIQCVRVGGYYSCTYPSGTVASSAPLDPTANPLKPGPITFATNGGADFRALASTGAAAGTLTVGEDLSVIRYSVTADTILHISCTDSCASGRIGVNLTALQSSTTDAGWPYPSVGILRCVFAGATVITLSHAAVAAMFATDTALDNVLTTVAFLPAEPIRGADSVGNVFIADVGRGVFGTSPR